MKNKGFTLIELLAVIVVLAIIALIATPMILNVVEKARKGAAKSSALGYIDAVEKQIMVNQLNENPEILDGEYSLPMDNKYKISIKGSKPSSGNMTITKSKVASATMCINNYTVTYNGKTATVGNKCDGTIQVSSGPTKVEAKTGETHKGIVYLDPTDLTKTCNETLASQNVNSYGKPTEIKTGCMKWYIFDDSGDNYTMILDHNTTVRIRWYDNDINVAYEQSNLKAVVDDLVTTSSWKVTPRLITAEEVNTIVGGVSTWNVSDYNSWFFFEGTGTKKQSRGTRYDSSNRSKYDWLYNNLYACKSEDDYGCSIDDNNIYTGYGTVKDGKTQGYWTSTPIGTARSGSYIWHVTLNGSLSGYIADNVGDGIRPVITISKSIIKN